MSLAASESAGRPYLDAIEQVLGRATASNLESLPAAARLVADVVTRDGIVYVFGSGHSQLVALEVSRRAGSLVPLQVVFDPMWGRSECVEGFGGALLDDEPFTEADCLIVISNSGTTITPIEVALAARSVGTKVVVVTAAHASMAARSRHSSGHRLSELGDVVLDNGGAGSDAAIRIGSIGVGPTSTLAAAALLHEVIVEAVILLAARGIDPPIYRANSEDRGPEHNAGLRKRYRGRLKIVP